jgi:sugar transferase EpsL
MPKRLSGEGGLAAKRAFDIVVALTGLALAAPILLLMALAVRVGLGKPVLFCQLRPGLGGRPFMLLKFRTMTDARDEAGELLPDDQRMTPLGRFLRRSSLDELPELINVLKGEMSLVGPRPLLMEYLPHYTPEQARRHEVRPGLTDWAAIHGRNATTTRLDDQMISL